MESDKSLDVAVDIKVSFDHGSPTALYQQIVDRIWCDVIEGTLESGQRLPTVRQLAVNLGVHLDTVSRAYQQLERLGVVHSRPGAGTFVGLNTSHQSELEQQKRLREAFACYGQAIVLDPSAAIPHSRRGLLFCRFGQFDAAEVSCRKALSLDKDNLVAHAYLGIACSYLDNGKDARKHARIAEAGGMNMGAVWDKLGK